MARPSHRVLVMVRRAAVLFGVLVAVLAVPGTAAMAAPASQASQPSHASRASQASPASQETAVTVAARSPQQASSASVPQATGPCGVPGIGDIGSLFGLCQAGSSGLVGDLNNICQPSVPAPEPATSGIDALVAPPAAGRQPASQLSLYDQYGVAGQSWNAYDMQCSDMTSLIGNNVAGMVFDAAKALDRVTVTVYQSAAGEGILAWLTSSVDRLVTSLGNAVYFPYLAPVVLIGAMWLAWQGLIRKRATRTIEGTIWMVVACVAAIWLIGRPADFTGLGKGVSDGITQTLNVAFARLPAPAQSSCVPVTRTDPQVTVASYGYSAGNGIVDQNANELWTVLVCKPWLDGEFGTTGYATTRSGQQTVVNKYGRQLLWAQAVAANENATPAVIQAKQNTYAGIAAAIKQNYPAVYSLFQGKQWTTRLEIAFAAIFAALIAGLLVLLIAITLIILKLGFLLLLVVGPFFLIVGTHPGFGRVVAIRWVEMLIGVLLKQAAIALVLSVLLYAYSLIMGTSDAALPWALKILMIALVTVAVFIYRKPFAHLFSAVGYGVVGSRDRAEVSLGQAGAAARRNTLDAATVGVPGFAAYRAARWARRNPAQAASLAAQMAAAGTGVGAVAAASAAGVAAGGAPGDDGQPASPGPQDGGPDDTSQGPGSRAGAPVRGRGKGPVGPEGSPRSAPPLDLPSRAGGNGQSPTGWSRSGAEGTAAGRAPDLAGATGRARDPSGSGSRAGAPGGPGTGQPAAAPTRFGEGTRRPMWPGAAPGPARDAGPGRAAASPRPAAPSSGGVSGGRAGAGPRGSSQPGPPPAGGGQGAGASGPPAAGADPAVPFWLRPVRRKK
jgi:TrbL/VirB6 plasmid conjugal transfer protein